MRVHECPYKVINSDHMQISFCAVFLASKASKTDPFRKEVHFYLPRTDHLLCLVSSLSYFLHCRGNLPGPLFIFSDGTALSRLHVTDHLLTILTAAGVDGNF